MIPLTGKPLEFRERPDIISWERPDIISYDPLGRESEKFILNFIHRGSCRRNPSRRNTVTVGCTGNCVIQIYSKEAGRGLR